MSAGRYTRRACCGALLGGGLLSYVSLAHGQDAARDRAALREPLYRTANSRVDAQAPSTHPLDPALKIARDGLARIRSDVHDYSCTLVKRERVRGVLSDPEYIYTEIRNRKFENNRVVTPFSVYMFFLKPSNIKGREVIFVEGRNNNKLVAHEGGNFLKLAPPVWLRPEGPIAMRGNLYPITHVGLENLIDKLIERGERDRSRGECEVKMIQGAKLNKRPCTVLQVMHPVPRPYFDFHIARVFIDDELNLPVRYAAYTWPTREGGKPEVTEEYTYLNLAVNVGLTDADFDHRQKFNKRR